jgi:hypothetical protein
VRQLNGKKRKKERSAGGKAGGWPRPNVNNKREGRSGRGEAGGWVLGEMSRRPERRLTSFSCCESRRRATRGSIDGTTARAPLDRLALGRAAEARPRGVAVAGDAGNGDSVGNLG